MFIELIKKKAQVGATIIGTAIAIIVGVIVLSIVSTLTNESVIGIHGLAYTVISYIGVGLAISLLVIAFGMAMGGKE